MRKYVPIAITILICNYVSLQAQQYSLNDLGVIGDGPVFLDINENEQVAGWYFTINTGFSAFYWENGNITQITPSIDPQTFLTAAVSINDSGYVLMCEEIDASESFDIDSLYYYIWKGGSINQILGMPDEFAAYNEQGLEGPSGRINNENKVVALDFADVGNGANANQRVYLWNGASWTQLAGPNPPLPPNVDFRPPDINNDNLIVAHLAGIVTPTPSIKWENLGPSYLPFDGRVNAVNDSSNMTGGTTTGGFIYKNGVFTNIFSNGIPGTDINNKDEVVGFNLLYTDGQTHTIESLLNATGNGYANFRLTAINDNSVIVGSAQFNGQWKAVLLRPAGLKIERPIGNVKWIAGETDTIKWSGGEAAMEIVLEYSIDDGNTFELINFSIPADSGYYVWDVPDTLLSTKCRIRICDQNDTTICDTSDKFRIKPYILTKLDSDGDYIFYDIDNDRWGFRNNQNDMWPQSWWQRFNYQGIDPFTGMQYSQWQCNFVFASSLSTEFPDWLSFVNAFSENACYKSTSLGIYSSIAVVYWDAIKRLNWRGSCFGIAAANALAFSYKAGFNSEFPSFPTFTDPITVVSDSNVIPVVNELYAHNFGFQTQQYRLNSQWYSPNQTLNQIKSMFYEDDVQIRTLSFWNNNGRGAHTILPYFLVSDDTQKEIYYLYVYDNSKSDSTNAYILFDTTANFNNGSWVTTYGWNNWGGDRLILLEEKANNYLDAAILPKNSVNNVSPFLLEDDKLRIFVNITSDTRIADASGNQTGYFNGLVFWEIPNSMPLFYPDATETSPYGYSLQTDNYSIVLDEFTEDTVETYFFTGNKAFVYERDGAEQNQTDRLFFDGDLSAVNPDAETKIVQLLNIINETTQEKLTVVRSLELVQNDSVKIENPDSNTVKLISYGSAKDYDIELNYPTANGIGRFGDFNVQLSANTTHTFVPEWTDITNTELMVLVDNGNNGTIDDTLYLQNQVTGIEGDQGSLLSPKSYNLAQNYPNPFNPVTTIQYSIPQRSNVVLIVYDVLGKEIAVLVNGEKDRGVYTVNFDASQFASGMYLYRLQAGDFIQTKKMILIK